MDERFKVGIGALCAGFLLEFHEPQYERLSRSAKVEAVGSEGVGAAVVSFLAGYEMVEVSGTVYIDVLDDGELMLGLDLQPSVFKPTLSAFMISAA